MKININIYFNKIVHITTVIYSLTLAASGPVFADSSPPQPFSVRPVQEVQQQAQPDDLWERIRLDLSWQTMHSEEVDNAREEYLRQPNYMPELSNRADYYLHYIVEEVQKRDMPMEIALLPVIESSLNPFASSPSGAAGLWQIMPETGILLGLEQDSQYDGRQALRESTTVALDYLEKLYEEFDDDWLLALAAYNSGAGNVARAQEANAAKGLDTDYWSLDLSRQAREFVPKLIAITQIVADPERFDVNIPPVENAPSFEVADTEAPLDMAQAAQMAGVDVDTLRALNPEQLGDSIAPNESGEILLPVGTRSRFEHNITQLSPEELVQWQTYRVKSGESLDNIARKFDTQVAALQEANGIRGGIVQAGTLLNVPTDDAGTQAQPVSAVSDAAAPGAAVRNVPAYRVRKGDSLYGIANRFNVSVNDLIAWNSLKPGALLQPGQLLNLREAGG